MLVKTARGTIRAQHAVVATNSSISDRFNIHTKTAPYRTYVMTFKIKRRALPDALYWDRNSATCSHVGCHLHWNNFETCWDCPCHGSMFNVDGVPINAPTLGRLNALEES